MPTAAAAAVTAPRDTRVCLYVRSEERRINDRAIVFSAAAIAVPATATATATVNVIVVVAVAVNKKENQREETRGKAVRNRARKVSFDRDEIAITGRDCSGEESGRESEREKERGERRRSGEVR